MSKRARKLNALEQKLHQAVLSTPEMTMTQKQIDGLESDATKRIEAINFLLSTGMLRIMQDAKKQIVYRAIGKRELDVKKDLGGEEVLVLNHIQAAANEGIWVKHLKTKTELHQNVIDKCLKSLLQKQLIKAIKNVKYPTRKTYILFHLEPSTAVTGGPWYTDNELDTEFIKLLSSACLKFIREKSFPKTKLDTQPLYPISAAPQYPTALQIQAFLSKSRITETQLSVEHIEMLLNVLVVDGDIEKLPAFGAALWEANSKEAGDEESDEEEDETPKKKKKKEKVRGKKRRRKASSDEDEESSEEEEKRKKKRKRSKVKSESSGSESESESESGSGSGSDDDGSTSHKRSKSKSKSKSKPKSKSKIDSSPPPTSTAVLEDDYGGAYVYRAIRQERVVLGWSQAPCARCPQFDFCKTGGPVNAGECEYYGEWLTHAEVKVE